jgi:hypothetical protein
MSEVLENILWLKRSLWLRPRTGALQNLAVIPPVHAENARQASQFQTILAGGEK